MKASVRIFHGVIFAAATALLILLPACSSGPGRCVGSPTASAQAAGENVLLNLDKDGVAIQGYDPVAFFTDAKPVKGDARFRSMYGGAVYLTHQAAVAKSFPESVEPLRI